MRGLVHGLGLCLAAALLLGCDVSASRAACDRDGDCASGEVCYRDGQCLPRPVAERSGDTIGSECTVVSGVEIGCAGGAVCRMGFCRSDGGADAGHAHGGADGGGGGGGADGGAVACEPGLPGNARPIFGGVAELSADGADALLVRWFAAADETLPEAMRYRIYVGLAAGLHDFATPALEVTGETSARVAGLVTGTTYHVVVRAVDAEGQADCNHKELAAAPRALEGCVDFATDIQPIFTGICSACHAGASAPRGLQLSSYAGALAGGASGNTIVPCQPDGSLLYQKISMATPPVGARMPFGGPYLSDAQIARVRMWIEQGAAEHCPVDAARCSDQSPPTFAGLDSATLEGTAGARLCWGAGSDDATAAAALLYDIYQAASPGGEVYTAPPRASSAAGATCASVTGLSPGARSCFVVRARDAAGNRDANTVERCVDVPAADCVDFAAMVQPIFSSRCIGCHSGPSAPRGLHLDSHAGVLAGGQSGNTVVACQPSSSLLYQKISMATPPVGVRMPFGGPYLEDPQIATIQQWISEGARASCAAADPCGDAAPPTFAGLASATALDATRAELCWSAAVDDATPAAGITYEAYGATAPGGEVFTGPPHASVTGATCVTATALVPGATSCFVVRARDGAGNRDANGVERCVTMPAVGPGCVDYATLVQPLFDRNCTRCHSGARPPQWLRLSSYEEALAGSARRNSIVACDAGASVLLAKVSATPPFGKRMPYDGPPYLARTQIDLLAQWVAQGAPKSCPAAAVCGDATRPSFAGATSATAVDATTLRVCWGAASDDRTPAAALRYDVYQANAPGGEAFGEAPHQTVTGATCADVRVGPGTSMCFVVRARDLDDNRDANGREVCAQAPAASCGVDYDELIQPIFSARCTHCHDRRPGAPRHLALDSYAGVRAGGALRTEVQACNWAASLIEDKTSGARCGRRMPADGPPWISPAERSLLGAWMDSGARRSCAEASPCGDSTPPTFAGATRATAVDATTIEVCWEPASDAVTAADGLVYEVFDGVGAGVSDFARKAPVAVSGGASCARVAAPMDTPMCYVVRARDLAGNRDGNSVLACARTAGACFDYNAVIQPVFDARCVHCHSGSNPPKGIDWSSFVRARGSDAVRPCRASDGKLDEVVTACEMPQDTSSGSCRACLSPSQTELMRQWVDGGASASCPWGGC